MRAAGSHVAHAPPQLPRPHPERVEARVLQVETDAHGAAGEHGQILDAILPAHAHERLIGGHGIRLVRGERRHLFLGVVFRDRDGPSVRMQNLDAQGAVRRVGLHVHEHEARVELHRARGEHRPFRACIHRAEAIAAQEGEAHRAAGVPLVRRAAPAAEVEPEIAPVNEETTAGGLHVAPVPVALLFRDINQRAAVRPIPVIAIAAEAEPDGVRFGPAGGHVLVPAPDGEEADHQTFVRRCVEVVELRSHLQISAHRIQAVRPHPHRRLRDVLPMRSGDQVFHLPIAAGARLAPLVAQAVNPHVAERIEKDRAAVTNRAGAQRRCAPVDAIRREVQREAKVPVLPVRAPHLVAAAGVHVVLIQPHGRGVPGIGLHEIAAGLHVELRLLPIQPVGGQCQRRAARVAGHIPGGEHGLHAEQFARERVLQQPAVQAFHRAALGGAGKQQHRAVLQAHPVETLRRVQQRAGYELVQLACERGAHRLVQRGVCGVERRQLGAGVSGKLGAEMLQERIGAGRLEFLHQPGHVLNLRRLERRWRDQVHGIHPDTVAEGHGHRCIAGGLPGRVRLEHGVV